MSRAEAAEPALTVRLPLSSGRRRGLLGAAGAAGVPVKKWPFRWVAVALSVAFVLLLLVAFLGPQPVSFEEVALAIAASALVGLGLMWLGNWEQQRFEQTESRVAETERRIDEVDAEVATVRQALHENLEGKRDSANAILTESQQKLADKARQAAENLEHADVLSLLRKGSSQGLLPAEFDLRGQLPAARSYLCLALKRGHPILLLSLVDKPAVRPKNALTVQWTAQRPVDAVVAALGQRAADQARLWPQFTDDVLVTLSMMVQQVGDVVTKVNRGELESPDAYRRIRLLFPGGWAITDAGLVDTETDELTPSTAVHDELQADRLPSEDVLRVAQDFWRRS
jgi:hypothetical protein